MSQNKTHLEKSTAILLELTVILNQLLLNNGLLGFWESNKNENL